MACALDLDFTSSFLVLNKTLRPVYLLFMTTTVAETTYKHSIYRWVQALCHATCQCKVELEGRRPPSSCDCYISSTTVLTSLSARVPGLLSPRRLLELFFYMAASASISVHLPPLPFLHQCFRTAKVPTRRCQVDFLTALRTLHLYLRYGLYVSKSTRLRPVRFLRNYPRYGLYRQRSRNAPLRYDLLTSISAHLPLLRPRHTSLSV